LLLARLNPRRRVLDKRSFPARRGQLRRWAQEEDERAAAQAVEAAAAAAAREAAAAEEAEAAAREEERKSKASKNEEGELRQARRAGGGAPGGASEERALPSAPGSPGAGGEGQGGKAAGQEADAPAAPAGAETTPSQPKRQGSGLDVLRIPKRQRPDPAAAPPASEAPAGGGYHPHEPAGGFGPGPPGHLGGYGSLAHPMHLEAPWQAPPGGHPHPHPHPHPHGPPHGMHPHMHPHGGHGGHPMRPGGFDYPPQPHPSYGVPGATHSPRAEWPHAGAGAGAGFPDPALRAEGGRPEGGRPRRSMWDQPPPEERKGLEALGHHDSGPLGGGGGPAPGLRGLPDMRDRGARDATPPGGLRRRGPSPPLARFGPGPGGADGPGGGAGGLSRESLRREREEGMLRGRDERERFGGGPMGMGAPDPTGGGGPPLGLVDSPRGGRPPWDPMQRQRSRFGPRPVARCARDPAPPPPLAAAAAPGL